MKTYYIILVALVLTSCTHKLTSSSYTYNSALSKGELLYYLPKKILQVKVTYIASVKTTITNGVLSEDAPSYKVKNIEISGVSVSDKRRGFKVKGEEDKLFFMSENTSVVFNEFGVIQSLQSDITDKSLETAENTLKGVASIAKAVAIAGSGDSPLEINLKAKIDFTNGKLVEAIEKDIEKDIIKFKKQLLSYYELLKQYYDNNKVVVTQSEVTFDFAIDPVLDTEIPLVPNSAMSSPIPTVNLFISRLSAVGSSPSSPTNAIEGLVYSIPEECKVDATVTVNGGTQTLFSNVIAFPQFGGVGIVPVTSKVFTNKKTTLEFDPGTGMLKKMHTESGSSSENLSKSISNSAEELKKTAMDLKYDLKIESLKKDKELKDLKESLIDQPKSEATVLQENVDLLKLQLEIEKLKQELADLQNETKKKK